MLTNKPVTLHIYPGDEFYSCGNGRIIMYSTNYNTNYWWLENNEWADGVVIPPDMAELTADQAAAIATAWGCTVVRFDKEQTKAA